jgi:sterol desaturase/sphingolipid hydroxylase (fatty acid hydroxylase superfamily)
LTRASWRSGLATVKRSRDWSLEHGRWTYLADFVIYGVAALAMAAALLLRSPAGSGWWLTALVLAGVAGWTLAEYLLHRFVLHGLRPFSDWHADHHRRPTALIGLPTYASVGLFALLVGLPAWLLGGGWAACAVGLGMTTGYLGYGCTHHVVHHGGTRSAWGRRRQRAHALHHGQAIGPGLPSVNFGVTVSLWDSLLGTRRRLHPLPAARR